MGIQTDLTKVEAIQAMQEGKKVTHRYYIPNDEWMSLTPTGKYLFEDGTEETPEDFWKTRNNIDAWLTGWSIYSN